MKKAASMQCKPRRNNRKNNQKAIPLEELRQWINTLTNTAEAYIIDNDKTVFDREPVYVSLWSSEEIEQLKNKIKTLHSWIK